MHVAATSSNQMKAKEKSVARRRAVGVCRSRHIAIAVVVALGACKKSTGPALVIDTAPVERRSIVLSAQANGTVEPIDIVEVKSKASGTIVKMPVDIGSFVKVGDLMVQIDPRDVQNQYDQAAADLSSATVARSTALSQLNRSRDLYKQQIITAQEMETATLGFANADANLIKSRTSLSIARVRLEDATVRAPTNGTIIERPVSVGAVITSATTSASGGTTILRMADLTKVRMRAFVNETDIGNVQPGQVATVTVDAFPSRRFVGVVEKVEPQAVVQSSVTMFPVLVTLSNSDGALKPGMNGQVVMDIARHDNVPAVPSDAIRNARDAATVAPVLGVRADSIRAMITAAREARGARGGTASSTASRGADTTGGRRFSQRDGAVGAAASSTASSTARRGFNRQGGGAAGATGAGTTAGTGGPGGAMIVFVKKDGKYAPRLIRAGISDFDYTEIVSGLQQGEEVALLGAAVLQAQRDELQSRIRSRAGGGLQQQTPAAGGAGGAGGAAGGTRGGGGRPPGA